MFIKWNQQKINYTKWQKENLSLASTYWQKRFVVVVDAKKRKPVDNFMMGTNWNQNRQLKKKKQDNKNGFENRKLRWRPVQEQLGSGLINVAQFRE